MLELKVDSMPWVSGKIIITDKCKFLNEK